MLSDAPKKKAPKSRPPLKAGRSTESGSNLFLTAAEQRASDKKIEKKTTEDAFDFLKDVKDVSIFNFFRRECFDL